jgi:hypothetical protein
MHLNKVDHVTTINQVAADLGESEAWLFDVPCEMDTEDGVIWIRGLGEDAVMAFTDFGIEALKSPNCNAGGPRRMATVKPSIVVLLRGHT